MGQKIFGSAVFASPLSTFPALTVCVSACVSVSLFDCVYLSFCVFVYLALLLCRFLYLCRCLFSNILPKLISYVYFNKV